jgi:succinoglycan biosynthesis transport protein ExoP
VNFYLLMSALRARSGIFALVLLVTILVTAVVSVLLPKKYVATASLLADARDEQSLSGPGTSLRSALGYLQTQTDVIMSQKVARKVVRDLRLTESKEVKADWESDTGGKGSFEDWVADQLIKNLKADTSASSIIQIMYTANDPAFAAQVANAFAKSYMDTVLELRVQPTRQAAIWFDEQLKVLRNNLEQAQSRLSKYQSDKNIIGEGATDTDNTRLMELSGELSRVQAQKVDMDTREKQAREFLGQGMAADKIPDVIASPFIQGLKAEYLRGEARLQELSTRYGPNYPAVQSQVSENEGLRQRLQGEMSKIVDGLHNQVTQLSRRENELRDAVSGQRNRLLQARSGRNELAVYTRDVETAQRAYDAALQRSTVSKIESRASQTNVALLNAAVEPREAAKPKIGLNILLSAIVGMMLAIAVVFLLETVDRRVRSYDDLYVGANVPVLAVLHAQAPTGYRLAFAPALPKPV